MNFNSVLLGSEDSGRLIAYYTRLFGEPAWHEGDFAAWMIGSGVISIGPHSEVHGTNPEPGRILVNLESHDVRGDFERLKAAGATVVREPYEYEGEPGSTIATFSDPDGNYFQLMSPMPMPEIGD
jgi:predicted enzyme related to lactoylglutathione lyase